MSFAQTKLSILLYGLEKVINLTARRYAAFRERLKEKNMTVQLRLEDKSQGRFFIFKDGKVTSKGGIHRNPDVDIFYRDAITATELMTVKRDYLKMINAMKSFQMGLIGDEELAVWFMETLSMMFTVGMAYGRKMGDGVTRYTSNTNGGPVFVDVKDGKILRITPIEFDDEDAPPWTIEARGKSFTPPRKTTISPHTLAWKSMIYSPDRILYPMKRVDFDPNGERNTRNRGKSGYKRISWDEALDIVAGEIKRVKRDHGPGAIMNGSGSHHTWGSSGVLAQRPAAGFSIPGLDRRLPTTPTVGKAGIWGAMHHWGQSLRLGGGEVYGTVEDCLKNCDMVVFWSSGPGGHQRRLRRFRGDGAAPVAQGAGNRDGAHRSLL